MNHFCLVHERHAGEPTANSCFKGTMGGITLPCSFVETASEHILQFFTFAHLKPEAQAVSKPFCILAFQTMRLPRNPERTVALRYLLLSKDAAVRAAIAES